MVTQITLPASDNEGDKDEVSDTVSESVKTAKDVHQQLNDTVDELELREQRKESKEVVKGEPEEAPAPGTAERARIKVYKIDLATSKRMPEARSPERITPQR